MAHQYDHVNVRRSRDRRFPEHPYRIDGETQGTGAVLITAYQAQEIVDGLARLGVTARPDS